MHIIMHIILRDSKFEYEVSVSCSTIAN